MKILRIKYQNDQIIDIPIGVDIDSIVEAKIDVELVEKMFDMAMTFTPSVV